MKEEEEEVEEKSNRVRGRKGGKESGRFKSF